MFRNSNKNNHFNTNTPLTSSGIIANRVNSFLSNQPAPGSTKPKAYINCLPVCVRQTGVLLDEQFKFVQSSSGAEQVGNDQEFKVHVKNNPSVTKSGYLYVFVSNELRSNQRHQNKIKDWELNPNISVYWDNLQVTHVRGPLLEETHYYPFGLTMAGISSKALQFGGAENRLKYNGKELQSNEFSDNSGLELYDFGARMQDPQLGRWWTVDPLAHEYPSVSPYVYVLNNPINAIDPDGRRVYFVGGANNDRDGWNYINRWRSSFANAGINDFVRVNASHGKAGDVMFTNSYRNSGTEYEYRMRKEPGEAMYREYTGRELPINNSMINSTVKLYKQQLADNPLKEGEQFNLAGYSYGSVLQAQAALKLANDGVVVDNLVLIGSPISDDSKLYKQLSGNKNIKNIIRIDIPNDGLSNPSNFTWGGIKTLWNGDNAPHFDLARPGAEADKKIQQAVDQIKKEGVKN